MIYQYNPDKRNNYTLNCNETAASTGIANPIGILCLSVPVRIAMVVLCIVVSAWLSVCMADSRDREPDVQHDFDSLLRLSKNMTLDQIRHRGRSVFLEQKNPRHALQWYRTALTRPSDGLTDNEQESLARIYSNMAHIYFYEYGNAQQAYTYLMKSSAICNANKEKEGFALTDIYYTFADIYIGYDDFSKASYYLKKGFDVSLDKDIRKLGYSFANLAWLSILNDSVANIRNERRQFVKAQPADTSVLVPYCKQIIDAMEYIERGDYKEAALISDRALADRTFAIPDNPDNTILRYQAAALLISAHLYVRIRDAASASERISEAEKIITEHRLYDLYDFMYKEQADCYRLMGNRSAARDCEFKAMSIRDSLYNSQKYGLIRNLEEDWKVSEMEDKLRIKEDERQILLIQHNKQRAIMLTMGVSAVAIICLLIWIFLKNRKLSETNASLFRKNVELADALTYSAKQSDNTEDKCVPSDIEPVSQGHTDNIPDASGITADYPESDKAIYATYEKIRQILSESPEIYNPDFTIETLSHISGIHSRRISQAINSMTGKSFSTLLGEYRIAEACRQLTVPGVRPIIAAVAENVGYRSRTHFSAVFKTVTGMTTTEFVRQASHSRDTKNNS